VAGQSAKNGEPDLSPVIPQDPLDVLLSVTSIVHWADSRDVRLAAMEASEFPVDDMPMFLVVNQLCYRGALRPTDIAAVLGMSKTNISKIIRRLEQSGLVTRAPSPSDDRSVLIALTAEGRVIGERIIANARRTVDDLTAVWTDEEVQTLRRVLAHFAQQARHEIALHSPALRTLR
jgi:DNA-binding MarR family transcriptional regulator